MSNTNDVLFSTVRGIEGNIGLITLNRQQVLNSINLPMVQVMLDQLTKWGDDATIKAVVIKAAEGRAFCAGGDLRSSYENGRLHAKEMAEFFRVEYTLNKAIFHFNKPYIAFLDGITMGGGVGISIHGSHRVGTERLVFAMPETGIGFFPDVGGTYFLPRLPGKVGFYLGLSGARLKIEASYDIGIATHVVASANLTALLQALAATPFEENPHASVSQIIAEFETAINTDTLPLEEIDAVFTATDMASILKNLTKINSEFCLKTKAELLKKSPTSLKVTLQALKSTAKMDFDTAMQQEFRLSNHFLQAHDFAEGIRAVIIDKDQSPVWQPATLDQVSEGEITTYFSPLQCELV